MIGETALNWLIPTLAGLFLWGIAQGLVKKYINDVPPARFCLYYAIANAMVGLVFWFFKDEKPALLAEENRAFLLYGLLAYVMDGIAWIFYYQSVAAGPISIVGTLSAAYPGLAILFARIFLQESLTTTQYTGAIGIVIACIGLAYTPFEPDSKQKQLRWIPYATAALIIWGINATIIKYAYNLPGADSGSLALCLAVGGLLTLGVYGFLFGRKGATSRKEWIESAVPMITMALGGLMVMIAYETGPVSIVTPLSGAYPVVTLGFAAVVLKERLTALHWICIAVILIGMVLTTT